MQSIAKSEMQRRFLMDKNRKLKSSVSNRQYLSRALLEMPEETDIGEKYGSCSYLVKMCIDSACASKETVDVWRRQKRTLERMPAHLAALLFLCLLKRRLLHPSLLEIFQQSIEEVNLKGESMVDMEWMVYLGAYRHLRILNLSDCKGVKDSGLWNLSGLANVEDLDLSRCSKITDRGLEHLLSLSNLKRLNISETSITSGGVACLHVLTSLTSLDLGGLPITDTTLSSLQALSFLQKLDLWGSEISNDGATFLAAFSNLKYLNVAWTNVTKLPAMLSLTSLNMSNCTVESLTDNYDKISTSLQFLYLSGVSFINMERVFSSINLQNVTLLDLSYSSLDSLFFIFDMNKLECLDLSCTKITDSDMYLLAEVGRNLKRLNLNSIKISSNALLPLAGKLCNLEFISLSHTCIDDYSLAYLAQMPALHEICLSHTNIKGFLHAGDSETDFSLACLQELKHLESLELDNTKISDVALQILPSLKQLRFLSLKSDLSDISLHINSSLPNLELLSFQGAVLTDSGLGSFVPPPSLKVLDLRDCWLLSSEGLLRFLKSHPKLQIRHELMLAVTNHCMQSCGNRSMPETIQASTVKQRRKNQSKNSLSKSYSNEARRKFIDERIRYRISELLELQPSADSALPLPEIDSRLSELFEKRLAR